MFDMLTFGDCPTVDPTPTLQPLTWYDDDEPVVDVMVNDECQPTSPTRQVYFHSYLGQG